MSIVYHVSSEAVSPAHPDKLADQISDAVLQRAVENDKDARVACEVFLTGNTVVVGGQITCRSYIDIDTLARKVLKSQGYISPELGIDAEGCSIIPLITDQSPDIAQGVSRASDNGAQGAGDQGMVYGYACSETKSFMPLPLEVAHKMMDLTSSLVISGSQVLRPDGKCQITLDYDEKGQVLGLKQILVSHQHAPEVSLQELREYLVKEAITPALEELGLSPFDSKNILINPTGRFVLGGPLADAGLTGRKLIADTYGGFAPHGGGAMSGKDLSKVDRLAAYMTRYVAKNIVAAGIAKTCTMQVAYAIGRAQPVSFYFKTGDSETDKKLTEFAEKNIDFTPNGMLRTLHMENFTNFLPTSRNGQFGNSSFPWEGISKELFKNF